MATGACNTGKDSEKEGSSGKTKRERGGKKKIKMNVYEVIALVLQVSERKPAILPRVQLSGW